MRYRLTIRGVVTTLTADQIEWPFLRSLLDRGIPYDLGILPDDAPTAGGDPVPDADGDITCPECKRVFVTPQAYGGHRKIHTKAGGPTP